MVAPEFGLWFLVSGFWSLVSSRWSLVFILLVCGLWSLVLFDPFLGNWIERNIRSSFFINWLIFVVFRLFLYFSFDFVVIFPPQFAFCISSLLLSVSCHCRLYQRVLHPYQFPLPLFYTENRKRKKKLFVQPIISIHVFLFTLLFFIKFFSTHTSWNNVLPNIFFRLILYFAHFLNVILSFLNTRHAILFTLFIMPYATTQTPYVISCSHFSIWIYSFGNSTSPALWLTAFRNTVPS